MKIHNMNPGSPPRLREQLRASTHQTILDAAESVFEKDIAGARMEDIAAQAGVAVGTIYNHFADRQSLLDAVIEARESEVRAVMGGVVKKAKGRPFPQRLESFMQAALDLLERHRGFFSAAWQGKGARVHSPSRRSMLRELHAHAETLVREGIKEGSLRADGADLYPMVIVGMLRGVTGVLAAGNLKQPLHTLCQGLVRCFLEGAARG
jgi:AcrR family transcriptional regulator